VLEKKDYKDDRGNKWKFIGVAWALGIQFATAIVVCIVAGYYLDRYLNTAPVMLSLFTIGGFAGGLWSLYTSLKKVSKNYGNKR